MKERKWCFWLFGWGWKRGEILVGSTSFLSFPSKTQSLQIGEKIEVKSWQKYLDKIAHIFFLLFFFWQLQSGRNKCGLPTICCFFFFFLGFTGRWVFLFYLNMMMCMNPWFTIVPYSAFFFLDVFSF